MKKNFTLEFAKTLKVSAVLLLLSLSAQVIAQTTASLGNPNTYIYGLTSNGEILEINSNTAATYRTIKNNSYSGNSPSKANGLSYNSFNGKFYYFKRNVGESPQEFVSFDPKTNTVAILASSTCTDETHTACISFDGKGYYTIDTKGNLNYYNILTNTWKTITSNIVDQDNNNVTSTIQSQSSGDIAMDGYGNIWVLTSSNSKYGLFKIPYPAPINTTAKLTVQRVIAPTANTPNGNSFAGIAFNATGQIFMATRSDDRLYLLQNNFTLSYIAKLSTSDASNDLTSQNFPVDVLPVKWSEFTVTASNNTTVTLNWTVSEYENKGFHIQHSSDGKKWEEKGFVASRNIAETTQDYTYSLTGNFSGMQYYRIKQVDIDGKISYSEIRTVTFSSNEDFSIWPNPAVNSIYMTNNEVHNSSVQVFDLSGKMVIQKQIQKGNNTIDISTLAPGTYIAKLNNERSIAQKFMKR